MVSFCLMSPSLWLKCTRGESDTCQDNWGHYNITLTVIHDVLQQATVSLKHWYIVERRYTADRLCLYSKYNDHLTSSAFPVRDACLMGAWPVAVLLAHTQTVVVFSGDFSYGRKKLLSLRTIQVNGGSFECWVFQLTFCCWIYITASWTVTKICWGFM